MTKALRERLQPGQVYEVTNFYISRPKHLSFGTRIAAVTDVNGSAFRLEGTSRIPFPKQAQIRLNDDGSIELFGGGIGQSKDELFLALVPVPPDRAAAAVQGSREYRNATVSGPAMEDDPSTLFAKQHVWTLDMAAGGPKRLIWPEGSKSFRIEQQDPAGRWVATEIDEYDVKVSDRTLQTATTQVEEFLTQLNATLETNARNAQRMATNRGVGL